MKRRALDSQKKKHYSGQGAGFLGGVWSLGGLVEVGWCPPHGRVTSCPESCLVCVRL
jgi:hypothetical protein